LGVLVDTILLIMAIDRLFHQ